MQQQQKGIYDVINDATQNSEYSKEKMEFFKTYQLFLSKYNIECPRQPINQYNNNNNDDNNNIAGAGNNNNEDEPDAA